MSASRSLDDWLRIQETVHGTGIDLTLERVRAVAQRMGLLPVAARSIIVAGTNVIEQDLDLSRLKPGAYRLEVRLVDAARKVVASRSTDIRLK